MAGDWFPIVIGLHDEPEVIAMAARLKLTEDEVVGKLCRLWGWANQHTADGRCVGVTFVTLDRYASCDGFATAMSTVGWLTETTEGVQFPKFDVYNSVSAKRRIMATKRQQKWRSGRRQSVTETSTPPSTERRLEKRREENIETGVPVSPAQKKPRSEKQVERDSLWDAIVAEWKLPTATKTQQGRVGRLVGEFRGCGAIPAELPVRRKRIADSWGPEKATPESTAKHWGEFDGTGPSQNRVGRIEAPPGKYDAVMAKAKARGTSHGRGGDGDGKLAFPAPGQEPGDRGGGPAGQGNDPVHDRGS